MIRRALPSVLRLVIVVLALAIGFLIGQRSVAGRAPATSHQPPAAAFIPFTLPDPTLPPGCCLEDDSPEARRTISGPADSLPLGETAHRTTSRRSSGSETTRSRGRSLRVHEQLAGVATWHATGRDGLYAAAGPLLRQAIGRGWRGRQVLVCNRFRCVNVYLVDWCKCRHDRRLVDLSDEAFRYLAPLSRGVLKVTVGW